MTTPDLKTIEGARRLFTTRKNLKLAATGPLDPGTEVICLRRNENYGHYEPCYARIHHATESGKIAVDLWDDGSERVVVSPQAILWRSAEAA